MLTPPLSYLNVVATLSASGLPGWLSGKDSACKAGDAGSIPEWEDPLEKEMAAHSSILAWETQWIQAPGGLPSMGSQKSLTRLSY